MAEQWRLEGISGMPLKAGPKTVFIWVLNTSKDRNFTASWVIQFQLHKKPSSLFSKRNFMYFTVTRYH